MYVKLIRKKLFRIQLWINLLREHAAGVRLYRMDIRCKENPPQNETEWKEMYDSHKKALEEHHRLLRETERMMKRG